MKYALFVGTCLLSCCKNQNDQSLHLLFAEHLEVKPACSTKFFAHADQFCSQSLWLNDNSTFVMETGCEGRSNVHLGLWTENNGVVTLNEGLPNSGLLQYAEWSDTKAKPHNSIIRFFDICGQPIEGVSCILFREATNDKDSRVLTSDISGTCQVSHMEFDSLHIPLLDNVRYNLLLKGLPTTLDLHLNINAVAIMYSDFKIQDGWGSIELYRTDSGLTMDDITLAHRKP